MQTEKTLRECEAAGVRNFNFPEFFQKPFVV